MLLSGTPIIITKVNEGTKYNIKVGDLGFIDRSMVVTSDDEDKIFVTYRGIGMVTGKLAEEGFMLFHNSEDGFNIDYVCLDEFTRKRKKYPNILPELSNKAIKNTYEKAHDTLIKNEKYSKAPWINEDRLERYMQSKIKEKKEKNNDNYKCNQRSQNLSGNRTRTHQTGYNNC